VAVVAVKLLLGELKLLRQCCGDASVASMTVAVSAALPVSFTAVEATVGTVAFALLKL